MKFCSSPNTSSCFSHWGFVPFSGNILVWIWIVVCCRPIKKGTQKKWWWLKYWLQDDDVNVRNFLMPCMIIIFCIFCTKCYSKNSFLFLSFFFSWFQFSGWGSGIRVGWRVGLDCWRYHQFSKEAVHCLSSPFISTLFYFSSSFVSNPLPSFYYYLWKMIVPFKMMRSLPGFALINYIMCSIHWSYAYGCLVHKVVEAQGPHVSSL